MAIFNSLGSNYDFRFVIRSFSAANAEADSLRLKTYLEERYGGQVALVYKGREAIQLALRTIGLTDAAVGICGFTCFAVYEAIVTEGYSVVYLDIDESLNFSLETVEKAVQHNPKMKIIMIQNTLGYPTDAEKIAKFCQGKGIILIEDLAHCIGTNYISGQDAGMIGDFVILSFSQDKVVDGISGGALVIRNKDLRIRKEETIAITQQQQHKDRFYPLLTWLIRKMYGVGLGKILHFSFKKMKVLQSPMDNQEAGSIHGLPHWLADLTYQGYKDLSKIAKHRLTIAQVYAKTLDKNVLAKSICNTLLQSANLRFPIFINNREKLLVHLKKKNIYISDTWYDAPIGPRKYLTKTDYKNQCPKAEKIANTIINLPTHRNVSAKDARVIAEEINAWLK